MKYINTFSENMPVSQVALGCMRIGEMSDAEADAHILGAVECGINYFDHADIYGGGAFLTESKYSGLHTAINELAEKYGVTDTGIAIAWLLRLPDKMQPIVGSTNVQRVRDVAAAADIEMSREDWYKVYLAAGYRLP